MRWNCHAPSEPEGVDPQLEICEYVLAEVADTPSALPDGQYELRFEGRSGVKKNAGVGFQALCNHHNNHLRNANSSA
jgi:hypothetical protein